MQYESVPAAALWQIIRKYCSAAVLYSDVQQLNVPVKRHLAHPQLQKCGGDVASPVRHNSHHCSSPPFFRNPSGKHLEELPASSTTSEETSGPEVTQQKTMRLRIDLLGSHPTY